MLSRNISDMSVTRLRSGASVALLTTFWPLESKAFFIVVQDASPHWSMERSFSVVR